MNEGPSDPKTALYVVSIGLPLYEAMAACYYGMAPRHHTSPLYLAEQQPDPPTPESPLSPRFERAIAWRPGGTAKKPDAQASTVPPQGSEGPSPAGPTPKP